jgi:hypothetical protein
MFEYFHSKIENLLLTPSELHRLHNVIIAELKKHEMKSMHKGALTVDHMIRQIEDTGPDEYETDKKKEASMRLTLLHVF